PISVKKGDLIASSGNTGGSGGPRLHFEIRDGNQRPMNPMLFGFDIADNIPPVVSALYAYVLDDNSHINQSQQRTKVRLVKHKDGNYIAENIQALGRIGFGITAIDQLDGASNHNGVYQIDTKLNNVSSFKVRFDKFSFDETRYLNRYIDYEFFQNNKTRVQKLFREENNPLSIIVDETDEGYLTIKDSLDYSYVIEVKDFKGNTTSIIVPITGRKLEILSPRKIQETEDLVLADH